MIRIVRNGWLNWGWRMDVPSLMGRSPRYEAGMDGYRTAWGARRAGKYWAGVL